MNDLTSFTLLQAGEALARRAWAIKTRAGTRSAASWLRAMGVPCELAVLILARI